jgi:Peptidase family M48
VPVFPGGRDSSSYALPWKQAWAALVAALCLGTLSFAQAPTTQTAPDTVNSTQTLNTSPEKPDPSVAPVAPAGSIPTAAQVEAAGAADPGGAPEGAKPAVHAAPNGVDANQPNLQPKYNVNLIGQRNVGAGLDFYSLDREMALGRSLANEVESSAKLVTDPIVTEYVNRIGQNLVRNSDARVPFTIKVLDNEEVNAFALPGGFFYVDSGLILAADNEAELAGVMAHEIAHVAARHATKNMTRAQIWNFATVPLIFVGGPVAYAVAEVAGLAVPLGFLKFSRDAEREADLLGLEYDWASGYDPQGFVDFFEKLNVEKKKPNFVAKAFTTHPMNVERIKDAQDEIRKYLPDRPEYVVDTSEFESVKARLMMLENGRRLGGKSSDPGRPVLLKRTATSNTTSGGDDPGASDRPVLKKAPGSDSGDSGSGSSSQPQTSTAQTTAPPAPPQGDDGPPVLKKSPSSSD